MTVAYLIMSSFLNSGISQPSASDLSGGLPAAQGAQLRDIDVASANSGEAGQGSVLEQPLFAGQHGQDFPVAANQGLFGGPPAAQGVQLTDCGGASDNTGQAGQGLGPSSARQQKQGFSTTANQFLSGQDGRFWKLFLYLWLIPQICIDPPCPGCPTIDCDPDYTAIVDKCCHVTCENCIQATEDGCTSCHSKAHFLTPAPSKCVCDDKFYKSGKGCFPCHEDCLTCSGPSNEDCVTCKELAWLVGPPPSRCGCDYGEPRGCFYSRREKAGVNRTDHFVLGVIGPSQFGKSSFINTLSGEVHAKVGIGNMESMTLVPSLYTFKDMYSLYNYTAVLTVIDMPGFFDTQLRIKDEDILISMKQLLSANKLLQLDGILVFQSLSESNLQVRRSLEYVKRVFGMNVDKSTLIVLTKWDDLDEGDLKVRINQVTTICLKAGISFVKWINVHKKRASLTQTEMAKQCDELRPKLTRLDPYTMTDMQEFNDLLVAKAVEIRENDPDRYGEYEVIIDEAQEYWEDEPYEETVIIPKYGSYEEIKLAVLKQLEIEGISGTHSESKTSLLYGLYTYEEKQFNKEFVDLMSDFSKATEAKNVTKYRRVKKLITDSEKSHKVVKYEKHDLDYYIKLAAEALINERYINAVIRGGQET